MNIFSGVNNKMTEVSKSAFTIAEIGPLILIKDLAYGQAWTMTFAQKNIDKMQCMHAFIKTIVLLMYLVCKGILY